MLWIVILGGLLVMMGQQNRSEALPSTPRPLIDTDHSHLRGARLPGQMLQSTQNRVIARRHVQSAHQPLPRQPAQGMANHQGKVAYPIGLAGIRFDDSGQRQGKEAHSTTVVATAPTAHVELQNVTLLPWADKSFKVRQ